MQLLEHRATRAPFQLKSLYRMSKYYIYPPLRCFKCCKKTGCIPVGGYLERRCAFRNNTTRRYMERGREYTL